MAGTTPIYGLPYPQSSDLVSAYPALGQDLATDLDGILAAKSSLSTLTTKGDLYVATASATEARLGVGTNGQVLTADSSTASGLKWANAGGLVLLASSTISGGTAISFTSKFSASYINYLILINVESGNADVEMNVRVRSGSSDDSGNNYSYQILSAGSTSVSASRTTSVSSGFIGYGDTASTSGFAVTLYSPFAATSTAYQVFNTQADAALTSYLPVGTHSQATSYDGCTIFAGAGKTWTGQASLYGYAI